MTGCKFRIFRVAVNTQFDFPRCGKFRNLFAMTNISEIYRFIYMHTNIIYVKLSARSSASTVLMVSSDKARVKRENMSKYMRSYLHLQICFLRAFQELIVTKFISLWTFNLLFIFWFIFLRANRPNEENLKQLHVDRFICNLDTIFKKKAVQVFITVPLPPRHSAKSGHDRPANLRKRHSAILWFFIQ